MNVEEALNSKFDSVVKQREELYRASKTHNEKEYQVHYFDLSKSVLNDNFDIEEYQKDILLSDYYSEDGSLQWNYYLHFLVEEADRELLRQSKKLQEIENNKRLARKTVDTVDEMVSSFSSHLQEDMGTVPNIVGEWRDILSDDVPRIFDDSVSATDILKSFMTGVQTDSELSNNSPLDDSERAPPFPFIEQLALDEYRQPLQQREFKFGSINLIRGPNAVGKTSLLEAIELCICGKSIRNPDEEVDFSFSVKTEHGLKLEKIERLNDRDYRKRDQDWYGCVYRSKNYLHESFSRFNYFDADAAFRFSDDVENGKNSSEALSRTLFGSESGFILNRINRLKELVSNELSGISNELRSKSSSLLELVEERDQLTNPDQKETTITLLKSQLKRLGLSVDASDEQFFDKCVSKVSFLEGNIPTWAMGQREFGVNTRSDLEAKFALLEKALDELDIGIPNKKKMQEKKKQLEQGIQELNDDFTALKRLQRYYEVGASEMGQLEKNSRELQDIMRGLSNAVGAIKDIDLSLIKGMLDATVTETRASFIDQQKAASEDRSQINSKLLSIQSQVNSTTSLVEELKVKGGAYSELHPDEHICPLCQSNLSPDFLADRLNSFPEKHGSISAQLSLLLSQLQEQDSKLVKLNGVMSVIESIDQSRRALNLSESITINQILMELEGSQAQLNKFQLEREAVETRIENYDKDGFSQSEFDELLSSPSLRSKKLSNMDECKRITEESLQSIERSQSSLEELKAVITNIEEKITQVWAIFPWLQKYEPNERSSTLDQFVAIQNSIEVISNSLSLGDNDSYSIAFTKVTEIKELLKSFRDFHINKTRLLEVKKKIESLDKETAQLRTSKAKLQSLVDKLLLVINEKQPGIYAGAFLKTHEKLVSSIFTQIHSPKEFEEVTFEGGDIQLKRTDGTWSTISHISTGQRTAVVLSVFLSMHFLNPRGPQLLVLDDPVTYVDDLNALAFLDYLRILVEENDRQIFFATANEKIAFHFQKKFDYLSNEKRGFFDIPLYRD